MIDPKSTERSLFAAILPPGPSHIDGIYSLAFGDNIMTVLEAGFWAALPLDYIVRITGKANLQHADVRAMPAPEVCSPLAGALALRVLRLNCLTSAYAPLWNELYDSSWSRAEVWGVSWPGISSLSNPVGVAHHWNSNTPLRTERERRCALVEIDALVAAWLGISSDQLVAIYRARYPILADREEAMWFDSSGRRIAVDPYAFGFGQTKDHWMQFEKYLENPEKNTPPNGYTPPFYKADRIAEYRQAHAVFSERLRKARGESGTR
jgi:hypothetical protein